MAELKNLWDRIFEFNRYFRLIQAVTAFCFHSLSLYFFVATFRWVRRTKLSSISTLLKFFLVVWIIEDTLAVPYSVYIAAGWRLHNAGDTYFEISFWTVVWERSFSCVIPITVCFLTVDRCLAVGLGMAYRPAHSNVLCGACILAATCASTLALYIHLWVHLSPEEVVNSASEGCEFTVCAFQQPDDWQAVVRVIFGTINLVSTVAFGFLLRQQRSKQLLHKTNSRNTGNRLMAYAVASELLLNFTPHAICLVYELTAQSNISRGFGTYSRFVTSLDALVCGAMYRRMIRPMRTTKTTQTQQVTPVVAAAAHALRRPTV